MAKETWRDLLSITNEVCQSSLNVMFLTGGHELGFNTGRSKEA